MVLQSTQGVQELLPRSSPSVSTQASSGETPFRNLLDDALQNRTQPPKAKEGEVQPQEPEQASSGKQPLQDAAPGKKPEQPVSTAAVRTPPSEAEMQEAATAVAAALWLPVAMPVQELLQAEHSVVATQQQTQPLQPLAVMPLEQPAPVAAAEILPMDAEPSPVSMPSPLPKQVQETLVPEQATPQKEMPPVSSRPITVEATNRILAETPPTAAAGTEMPKDAGEESPDRLDSLIAKASRELSAQTVGPEQTKVLEPESPREKVPSILKAEERALPKTQPEEEKRDQLKPEQQLGPKELPSVQIRGMQVEELPKFVPQPTPVRQVEVQMLKHLEQGKTEFRMQLAPEELGKVDVRMLLEDGKLTVQIVTATAKAAQELQRTGESLVASLRMAGAQLETVQIVHRPEEPSQQMGSAFNMESSGQQHSGQSHHGQSSHHTGQEADWEETTYPAQETPSRLLDQAV